MQIILQKVLNFVPEVVEIFSVDVFYLLELPLTGPRNFGLTD